MKRVFFDLYAKDANEGEGLLRATVLYKYFRLPYCGSHWIRCDLSAAVSSIESLDGFGFL
jgi:hypothetical protein